MKTKDLGGHSGCKILLCGTEKGASHVRKISSDTAYNKRLEAQCEKQTSYENRNIAAPKVFDKGYTPEGLFYFDMEFIRGITLAQYIKTVGVSDIRSIVEDIVRSKSLGGDSNGQSAQTVFSDKIRDVEQKAHVIHWSGTMEKCFQILKRHDWSRVPKSSCHGDLTLENIIVSGERLYYIDFLDSFYDSWVLDFGKLLQDTQTMWSYRRETRIDTNTLIRLHIFRDILLEKTAQISPGLVVEINYALLLHLMRIYPYSKEQSTIDFLDSKVDSTLRTIRCLEES